ncbi:MAG: RsmD family RNA methyltransferase [Cyanobacteria bacterium P01_H01_bin.15]
MPGQLTRPILGRRVCEVILNVWPGKIDACRCLDLCTSCGQMSAAALSHGASEVTRY